MVISIISLVLGLASLAYFIGYAFWAGINSSFLYFWAILGILGIAFAIVHYFIRQSEVVLWKRVEQIGLGIVLLCMILLLGMVGMLASEGKRVPSQDADYMIVLGAHVYGERMSANLRYRVEKAYEYLKVNPHTKAVLSGGQGQGEDITEAEAMRRYLEQKGIESDRLLLDETSVNTDENIRNSAVLIKDTTKRVVIVSNDFHIYRAKKIAKKQGFQNVEGIGSKTHVYTLPNSYVREVIAVIKYKLCGQI